MNVWTLAESNSSMDAAQAALIGMISHIGSSRFTAESLTEINRALEVGSWSVYRVHGDRPPVCYLSNSFRRRDTTGACFQVYRERLYRHDQTFRAIQTDELLGNLQALHLTAQDVPNAEHRHAIYEQHHIRERLSAAKVGADSSILSVNLYRHADQKSYGDRDLHVFQSLAPALFALVERHIALSERENCAYPRSTGVAARYRQVLQKIAPEMPARELDVCTRLLNGMSHDGVASDLGISAATVKTYRNRAFARLEIHHNNELFALVLRHTADVSEML